MDKDNICKNIWVVEIFIYFNLKKGKLSFEIIKYFSYFNYIKIIFLIKML